MVSRIVEKGPGAPPRGATQTVDVAEGALKIRHDNSWQVADSGNVYSVLSLAKAPDLTVWIEWLPAKGKSLDQFANEQLPKLRTRYEKTASLPKRTIGGAPAQQVAWLTGDGDEARETLQVEWIQREMLFRASISGSADLWQKHGPQVLRLLEDFSDGG